MYLTPTHHISLHSRPHSRTLTLHTPSQIKQNSPSEETDTKSVTVYEQVIANLSQQLEDLSVSLDCLRESDRTLRLSLRMVEQKALESEAKLNAAQEK